MQSLFFINDEDGLYSRVLIQLSEVISTGAVINLSSHSH